MDEVADRLGRDPAVAEQVIDARVDRDHAVEDARLRVDVELDQDRGLGVASGMILSLMGGQPQLVAGSPSERAPIDPRSSPGR